MRNLFSKRLWNLFVKWQFFISFYIMICWLELGMSNSVRIKVFMCSCESICSPFFLFARTIILCSRNIKKKKIPNPPLVTLCFSSLCLCHFSRQPGVDDAQHTLSTFSFPFFSAEGEPSRGEEKTQTQIEILWKNCPKGDDWIPWNFSFLFFASCQLRFSFFSRLRWLFSWREEKRKVYKVLLEMFSTIWNSFWLLN